jgi:Tol biopolymer transport system component
MQRTLMTCLIAGALSSPAIAHSTQSGSAPSSTGHLYVRRGPYIYAINPDGGGARQVTRTGTAAYPDIDPAVSPDGRQLAYARRAKGDDSAVYLVPATGGAPRPLQSDAGRVEHPAWSPDGRRVAYNRSFLHTTIDGSLASGDIIAINTAATGKNQDQFDESAGDYARVEPAWSPNGRTIVASQLDLGQGGSISLVAIDSGNQDDHQLTHDKAHDYLNPAYSPDGRRIACVRSSHKQKGDSGVLWLMNADGTGGHALAPMADAARPACSPDGKTIAFGNGGAVYTVAAPGGQPALLMRGASNPAWGR